MAISTPYEPTGEFVPVREWSCPVHESDANEHYCDCDHCGYKIECLDCEAGEWRDKRDENGNVVMRELSPWELAFRNMWERDGPTVAMASLMARKIEWIEDDFMPRLQQDLGGS